MASVTRLDSGNRRGYRIRFYMGGRRRELYVAGSGKRIQRRAEIIASHCDELAKAADNNVTPAPAAVAWANGTEGRLRERLVAWGLADPVNPRSLEDAGRLVGPFLEAHIASLTDLKPNTIANYKQARRMLVEYFGASHPIRSITRADAERWRRGMLAREVRPATDDRPAETMAVATVSKHVKRAKTMFAEAVKDRLLVENPFGELKGGSEANTMRAFYIDTATAAKVLDACPDADWRVIFALARFGGLRCPSEVLNMRWTGIDWAENRIRIDSPKTGLRFCPLFPELVEVLRDAHELAPDGSIYCVGRYHGGEANLRTQLGRILKRAGVKPWPKLFHNLRATRRTELQERFPSHVIDQWLGHSTQVAERHYLQVTEEHWERAVESRPPTRPPIANGAEPITGDHGHEKTLGNQGYDGFQGFQMEVKVPPQGLEPWTR